MSVQPAWSADFERFVEGIMAEHAIPGAAVALSQGGELIYARGFGCRDMERGLPVTADTIFGIASITKSFTALSVMQLAEAGTLSVDDPVAKHLPELELPAPGDARPMTIHHFLTHTAGLPPLPSRWYAVPVGAELDALEREEVARRHAAFPPRPPIATHADLLAFIQRHRFTPLGPPGSHYSYSNDGYALLGAIVERVAAQPFREYVAERILRPLGMTRTAFSGPELRERDDVTELYRRDRAGDVYHSPGWQPIPAMLGAGRLCSTARDLVRYFDMYVRGGEANGRRLLSPEGVARMTTPYAWREPHHGYGYGLAVQRGYHGVTLISHGGGAKAVSAHAGYVPERRLAAAVLTNLDNVPAERIWLAAVNAALGLPLDTPRVERPDYPIPAERLERFVGSYQTEEGIDVRIERDGDQLIARMARQRAPLRPVGESSFALIERGQEGVMRFLDDEQGDVWAVFSGGRVLRKAR